MSGLKDRGKMWEAERRMREWVIGRMRGRESKHATTLYVCVWTGGWGAHNVREAQQETECHVPQKPLGPRHGPALLEAIPCHGYPSVHRCTAADISSMDIEYSARICLADASKSNIRYSVSNCGVGSGRFLACQLSTKQSNC